MDTDVRPMRLDFVSQISVPWDDVTAWRQVVQSKPVVHGAGGAATACAPAARAAWPAAWVRVLQYRGPVYGHEMARSVGEIEGGRVGKEGGARTWQRQDVATIHVDSTHLFDEHGTVAGIMDDAK